MDPWVSAPLRVATPKDDERDRSTEYSAVDLLVDLVEHFRAVGAHVGQIAAGEAVDFGDEAVVVLALGDVVASAGHEIVEDHGKGPSMPHSGGWFLPPLVNTEHDIVMVHCKKKMLQCTIARNA